MSRPTRTVFLGSGEFAIAPATSLLAQPAVTLVAIVTAPARPAGRGGALTPTPVARWAAENGLPTLTPTRLREPEAVASVARLRPELLVLADYGRLVPAALLELPRHGALNLHPSLLPRHRGAAPIASAIMAGDSETGVTLMLMDEGLDTGPVLAQRRLALAGSETAPELERALADLAANLLGETLEPWLSGAIVTQPQPAAGATLTRPLRRGDGRLAADRPAIELERQVRAYQPWPGSFLEFDGDRLIVWRAAVARGAERQNPGQLVEIGSTPALVTSVGLLLLLEVQPAGGRRMAGDDWWRGRAARLQASPVVRR